MWGTEDREYKNMGKGAWSYICVKLHSSIYPWCNILVIFCLAIAIVLTSVGLVRSGEMAL